MEITSGSAEHKGTQTLVLQQSWEEANAQILEKPTQKHPPDYSDIYSWVKRAVKKKS